MIRFRLAQIRKDMIHFNYKFTVIHEWDKQSFESMKDEVAETNKWCIEQFGPEDGVRWASWQNELYYFRRDIDAFNFRLRWC